MRKDFSKNVYIDTDYIVDKGGEIADCGITAANRIGYYKRFVASAKDTLNEKIEIEKK